MDASDEMKSCMEAMNKACDSIRKENARLKERTKKAEEVMSNYGFVSGMLDVCEGGDSKSLLNLCHESRDRLREASDAYWLSLKEWEVPIWQSLQM